MPKVIVIDTSIMCVWLQIPGFENCGSHEDMWNYERVNAKIQKEIEANTTLVLPLATIIETGNHISQAKADRYQLAQRFTAILRDSVNNEIPWAAFSEQSELWNDEAILRLANQWPQLAVQKMSLGDATIKDVAEFYAKIRYEVEIFTGDDGLRAYQPTTPPPLPPRRR